MNQFRIEAQQSDYQGTLTLARSRKERGFLRSSNSGSIGEFHEHL